MAATRWSIRNYNTVLGAFKAQHGLTHRESQQAYRNLRDHLGKSVRGIDVTRHPRIAKKEAERAVRQEQYRRRKEKRARASAEEIFFDEYEDIEYDDTAEYEED